MTNKGQEEQWQTVKRKEDEGEQKKTMKETLLHIQLKWEENKQWSKLRHQHPADDQQEVQPMKNLEN